MEESAKAIARPAASRSLREAVRKARLEEAERLHLSADARDGEIARLELLKSELETVFAELQRLSGVPDWDTKRLGDGVAACWMFEQAWSRRGIRK